MNQDDPHGESAEGQSPPDPVPDAQDAIAADRSDSPEEEPDAPPIVLPPAAPVAHTDRIATLDLLRGFAILGILLVNVWAYGLPFPAALNPRLVGFEGTADRIVYAFVHMFAYTKTMPIFSMLFGAGIVLFTQRLADRGRKPAGLFFRRELWLLVFGLVHAYLIWNGDILVPYAVIGLILYKLRLRRPRTLLILMLIAMLVPKAGMQVGGYFMEKMQAEGLAAAVAQAAGDSLDADQERALEAMQKTDNNWNLTAQEYDEISATMRGSYPEILAHTVPETAMMHLAFYPMAAGWNIAAYMLLGMLLFKTGVLSGERPAGFYVRMATIAYGIGIPGAFFGLWYFDTHGQSFIPILRYGFVIVDISGPLVALGHIALLNLAWQRGWLGGFEPRLAAAGRMAFTNYITQTLICTTLFHGWGLGLFGAMNRLELLGVAVAIWILQLWWSPLWLRRYRFGPLEWLWRSLTYGRRQPFRLSS